MKRSEQGFTLIELVVVIVLLGIVGAVATARFQDLSTGANSAALSGVAAELGSASAINYAASVVPGGTAAVTLNTDGLDCATVGPNLFQSGAVPTGYTVTGTLNCATAGAGVAETCTVTQTSTTNTANVSVICTS